ncbi:hypothetical protein Val02_80670 [Virgisporangium aliadipatigenens]|uniref:Ankyrin repeat domain-containing protein n=1 Tax=Virgisporangium aliadipatigenens TaxID=741659 RepID=A0A8J3YTD8_9ACTN|nr:ankyrin repeat domain-containing protein [Virgisporangium aliadipatigenens]GIJ51181.1 hypothetical protein Val02_80670 [Virgisporangium aliadipatigenens]
MIGTLTGRRYGLPGWMLARATELRLAGDWRGACATAGVDVEPAAAAAAAADLPHLVPDLLRWHFPREPGDGLFRIGVVARLTDDGLTVHSPERRDHPQRLVLRPAADREPSFGRRPRARAVQDWRHLRHLWDARHADELRHRVGGGDRTPFFEPDGTPAELPKQRPSGDDPAALTEWTTLRHEAGEFVRAWEEAGFAVARAVDAEAWFEALGDPRVAFTTLLADARRFGADVVALAPPDPHRHVALAVDLSAAQPVVRLVGAPHDLPLLPQLSWERPADLDLLRAGLLRPDHLHPLVRTALFPALAPTEGPAAHGPTAAPQPAGRDRAEADRVAGSRGGRAPAGGVAGYVPPPTEIPPLPLTVRVACGGDWHPATVADNTLHLPAHSPAELARERAVAALGGTPIGCATVRERWRAHPPRPVRILRRHAILAASHGDGPELLRLLDAGLDPTLMRTRDGHTLAHLLAGIAPEHAPAVVRRLIAAGEDPNAADRTGTTPLLFGVRGGAPAATVRALLDAGADPSATLGAARRTALHLVRGADAEETVRLLVDAGVPVGARDRFGETPLVRAVDTGSVPAVRALLRAGADRTVTDRFGRPLVIIAEERGDDATAALLDEEERP